MPVSLATQRLLLRPFHADDHAAYAALQSDPEVMRYIGDGRPLGEVDSFCVLSMLVGHWELRGFGCWALEHKTCGAMIGHVGFWQPVGWPGVELTFRLIRPYWGKGLATEAAECALEYGVTQLGMRDIISLIHPANEASIGVAEKLGMQYDGEWPLAGRPFHVYRVRV